MKQSRFMMILLVLAILAPMASIGMFLAGNVPARWTIVLYQVTSVIYPAEMLVILITVRNSSKD